ncbi:enoyl-CoA hydratase/isomerase family protein [Leptospira noguchii]|uniref:enoyl-CoA hydratase/isomerase family protein n=1 Tax=Leptospira noguchii TaxID=28182 RepID=UPI0002489B59|nr:enoyl-CoA hydratase/isomerase family protein [Leptospira noguchii]EKR75317.1 enoyl-CoA hydratase/isomerase family protein [Leptospira noguchii str. 2006001870]UOG34674.1 enoyl-CoA hydratase/isomerase family protein [Leptospira noguchii]UOG45564.1 enoyl-CoA hydratase/isomerase family protein [Leptospira noguchii]UOG60986.1 enoyl-CoA hydratase/isomerase family protein [Leptospira noguchii]
MKLAKEIITSKDSKIGVMKLVSDGGPMTLTLSLIHEMCDILKEFTIDQEIRAGIISGPDGDFCVGLDPDAILSSSVDEIAKIMAGIFEMFESLISFPKPLIAEVGGNAVGGGAIIAYTCDYRYMVDGKGRIGFAEPLVGLPITSALIIRMRQVMLPSSVSEAAMEGALYKPSDAVRNGLLSEVGTSLEELRKKSLSKINVLNRVPASVTVETKRALNKEALEAAKSASKELAYLFKTQSSIIPNLLEAMTANKEKRRPVLTHAANYS